MGSPDENKALIRRFFQELDDGNFDALDELVAEDFVDHDPPPFPGLAPGRTGLRQAAEMFWKATPGHHVIEDQIAEGDRVVTVLRGVGKHEGEMAGIPPSGNDLDVKAITIYRVADGKIAEHWSTTDSAALLAQLGVIDLPPQG